MRNAVADTLYELAVADERIIVLVADISPAGAMDRLRAERPAQFINVGIAEQTMIGLAAGLAQRGFKPFCYTIATFALFRAFEFVRCDLAYQNLPVPVIGMGAGLSYGTLGGTHQAVDDVAAALAIPNLEVLAPSDPHEATACVKWCVERGSVRPVYIRLGKAGEPNLAPACTRRAGQQDWGYGEVRWLWRRTYPADAYRCVLSYGPIATEAKVVADALGVDFGTVSCLTSPEQLTHIGRVFDEIIVIEEAVGAPLAAMLRERAGECTIRSFALPREFCHQRGDRRDLLDHYGLTAAKIMESLQ